MDADEKLTEMPHWEHPYCYACGFSDEYVASHAGLQHHPNCPKRVSRPLTPATPSGALPAGAPGMSAQPDPLLEHLDSARWDIAKVHAALRGEVEAHQPGPDWWEPNQHDKGLTYRGKICAGCMLHFPCPTRRRIAAELGVTLE